VLAALPDPRTFDIQEISDVVYAALCNYWFDIASADAGLFALLVRIWDRYRRQRDGKSALRLTKPDRALV